jgi:hypothetical protein
MVSEFKNKISGEIVQAIIWGVDDKPYGWNNLNKNLKKGDIIVAANHMTDYDYKYYMTENDLFLEYEPFNDNWWGFEDKKNTNNYSIPIYENGIKTEWSIDGIIGDEKYLKLIELNKDGSLPTLINVNKKK